MRYYPMNRRMFLQSSGGFLLAIPFLPSLLTREALAASPAQNGVRLRYITLFNPHGGIWQQHLYPDSHLGYMQDPSSVAVATQYANLFGGSQTRIPTTPVTNASVETAKRLGFDFYADPLTQFIHALQLGGGTGFSELIGSQLSSYLDQMMIIRGLDTTINIGHHVGQGAFGDLGNNDTMGRQDAIRNATVDQVIAASSSFYPQSPARNTIYLGAGSDYWGGNTHIRRTSTGVEEVYLDSLLPISNMNTFFNQLVSSRTGTLPSGSQSRSANPLNVINSVLEDLRTQLGRTSREDRVELQKYMDGLNSVASNPGLLGLNFVEGTQSGGGTTGTVCGPAGLAMPSERPIGMESLNSTSTAGMNRMLSDLASITVALVKCNVTSQINIAVAPIARETQSVGTRSIDFSNLDLHQNVYHDQNAGDPAVRATNVERQLVNLRSHKAMADILLKGILDGLNVLDPITNNGSTYLNNSLVHWTMEHGSQHYTTSLPTILAGAAGGRLKTNLYVDLRRRAQVGGLSNLNPNWGGGDESGHPDVFGAPINRFWISLLRAMGIPRSEFISNRASLNNDTSSNGSPPSSDPSRNTTFSTYSHVFQPAVQRHLLVNLGQTLPFVHPNAASIDTE